MKLLFSFSLFATLAMAAGCEERFSKSGNPMTGSKYTSSLMVPGLSVSAAIAQIHGIAVAKNMDILTEDAPNGNMLLEDRASTFRRAIPYVVSVAAEGDAANIQLMVKLDKGVFAKAEDVKKGICAILAEVKGGEEGKAAAARGAEAVSVTGPRKVDAHMLSMELAHQTKESAESVPLRYKGKSFTISGRVQYVIKDGDGYRVAYDIPKPKPGLFAPPFKIDISCLMAPSHTAWAIALREGEKIKLTGTYYDFDQFRKVMWLDGCKPE